MSVRNPAAYPSPARLALYNAVPNVLWSALSLTPLAVFCYAYLSRPALYGLLGLSMLVFLLPRRWFRYWQLSQRPGPYRRLGVPRANYLTQHGGLVNRLLRQRYPQYRRGTSRQAQAGLWRASYHLEQVHLVGLLFFLGVSSYAAAHAYWGWAASLSLLNVLYNLYPI